MMLDLAEHQGDGYVALKDIAQRQGISKKYLEQIVPMLGRADVLRTTRGYQGGYRLARAPQEYTVGEILCLTEGGLAPVACPDPVPALRRMRHPAHVGGAGAGHPQLSRWHHAAGSARAADGARRERLRHLKTALCTKTSGSSNCRRFFALVIPVTAAAHRCRARTLRSRRCRAYQR